MNSLALIAPTILQSAALAAWLSGGRSARPEADRALALLFGLNAIAMTVALVPVSVPDLAATLVVLALPLAFMFGPLAFAYAHTIRTGAPAARPVLRHHVAPWFIVGLVVALPIATVVGSGEEGGVTSATAVLSILAIFLFVAVNAAYTAVAIALAFRRAPPGIARTDLRLVRRVVTVTAVALGAAFLAELPPILGWRAVLGSFPAAAIDLGCVTLIGTLVLIHRRRPSDAAPRYARSVLTEDQAQRLERKLAHAMSVERLYRDPDLSLARLAAHLGCAPHRLTHLFATRIGEGYSDHVNGWRIREACARLRDTDATVLEISLDTGFNTRSTFNAAFLRRTGLAPRDYRAAVRPQGDGEAHENLCHPAGSPPSSRMTIPEPSGRSRVASGRT